MKKSEQFSTVQPITDLDFSGKCQMFPAKDVLSMLYYRISCCRKPVPCALSNYTHFPSPQHSVTLR